MLSDSDRLYTFIYPSDSYSIYYVKGAFDSKMTNLNFLGSLDILIILRAYLWKKQASPHFYTKVKSVPVEAGFTDDCRSNGVHPQEALEPRLEGQEGVDFCLSSEILNFLRSNSK